MDLDPGYWLNLIQRGAPIVAVALLFGGPVGLFVWRRTRRRWAALGFGLAAALTGLGVVGYLYLTLVLCPPEAGCA